MKPLDEETTASSVAIVSFRGRRIEVPIHPGVTVGNVKSQVAASVEAGPPMATGDLKLMHKGKVLTDDDVEMFSVLVAPKAGGKTKTTKSYRLMATGVSSAEADATNRKFEEGLRRAPRVRDDLTEGGKAELARRRALGRKVLGKAQARSTAFDLDSKYGFDRIETLPNLPDEQKAREILTSLANDPGVLACMAKHKWNVGCLAELYPEGKVGESEVCVMGLNQNKGQKILLRVRTDDLKGFRKILSLRKVLFHELAHNVHSEHDGNFFQLMRQIERECNEMDWTQGEGNTTGGASLAQGEVEFDQPYVGGSYRLGGESEILSHQLPARELAARAAMMRMTAEEEEIQRHCGCGSGGNVAGTVRASENGNATLAKDTESNDSPM